MSEQGFLLTCCLALPVLIVAIGVKFHRVYNRRVVTAPKPQSVER